MQSLRIAAIAVLAAAGLAVTPAASAQVAVTDAWVTEVTANGANGKMLLDNARALIVKNSGK